MKIKRITALLLSAVMLLVLLSVPAFAGESTVNTGTRHTLCDALSAQAEAYYTGDCAWDVLSAMDGKETTSSVEAAGSPLFNALQNLMYGTLKNTVSYTALTSYWKDTDRSGGSSDAVLFYSDTFGGGYNREHVWPKSHGNFYQSGAGSDLHHLRPTNSTVNSTRSHWTFGNVRQLITNPGTCEYGGRTVLWYDTKYAGNNCLGLVEINDNLKGDVARILLYVYVTYGKTSGDNLNLCTKTGSSGSGNNANTGDKIIYDLDTLLSWCENDPVDTWEMSRNDCVENIQGNRNVFIDYPEFAWLLFGQEMPGDMDTPSGMAKEMQSGESFTVTAVSADPSRGAVTGSGRSFTAVPAEGCYVSGWSLDPENAATVTRTGNSFHLSKPAADCTLTVYFDEKEAATVSYLTPYGVSAADQSGFLGESVFLREPTGKPDGYLGHDYSFVGWIEEIVEDTTEKPVFLSAGSEYRLSEKRTEFYGLYTYVTDDGGTSADGQFTLTDTVADGLYVIGCPESSVMMTNDNSSGIYLVQTAADMEGSVITNAKENNIFRFEAVGDSYAIYDCGGAALKCEGQKKVSLDDEKTEVTSADTAYLWNVSFSGSNVRLTPVTSGCGWLQYNAGAPRFTTYTSTQKQLSLYGGSTGTRHYLTLGYEYPVPPEPCPHENARQEQERPATCTAPGYTEGIWCPDCETWIEGHEVIPALNHVDEDPADGFCDRCGAVMETPPAPECPTKDYSDVPPEGNWAHKGIDFCVERGLMGSTSTTELTFEPDTKVSRAMVASILYRMQDSPAAAYSGAFSDVPENMWFTAAVEWCAQNGLASGKGDGRFDPMGSVTRQELAVFMNKMAAYLGKDASGSADLSVFADASSVPAWSGPYLRWAVSNGLISGKTDGGALLLAPAAGASRAELASVIMRFVRLVSEAD